MALFTLHGGGHGATTDPAAGVLPGAMGGEAMPVPTYTDAGAITHMPIHALLGRILIPGIMVLGAELPSKTLNVAQWELPGAVPTPTSIRETRLEVVALQPTIPTRE